MRAKQWGAMAGLDPRQHPSGSSASKKPHLSKAGNRYLRIALYMPALSAARHDPNQGLLPLILSAPAASRSSRLAVCAVMRKLLFAIHAMLRTNSPFDSRCFFSPTETTT